MISALDVDQLRFTQARHGLDQPSGGGTEHHPARRGDRLHPLRHADLLADRGVPGSAGADLPGDHLPRVQPDPQLKIHTITAGHLIGQIADATVDVQGGPACPQGVVFQRDWRPEHGHDPVAGELVHRPAVAFHHSGGPIHQLRHDLAQPLRTHRRGDVHRVHHVGEQNRDLLVLRPGIAVLDR